MEDCHWQLTADEKKGREWFKDCLVNKEVEEMDALGIVDGSRLPPYGGRTGTECKKKWRGGEQIHLSDLNLLLKT